MFLRSIAYLPVQSKIFKGKTIQNATIKRGKATGDVEKVCKKPCPASSASCTDKIKLNQARLQHEEACPIWLKSKKDKLIYLTTIGLAISGVGLALYNTIVRMA